MFKRFFPLLLLIFLIWCESAYAETFNNTNYLTWNLTNNQNQTQNSGNTPFFTSYSGSNYDYRLYLRYTNYTAYPDYFYDLTMTFNYSDSNNMCDGIDYNQFGNMVTSCNIYVNGSSNQSSDGCSIVSKSCNSITIKTTNLKSSTSGQFEFQFNTTTTRIYDTVYVQLNSYTLDIIAKQDNSLSSQTIDNAANSIINNSNQNTQDIIDSQNDNTQDIINNQNDNTQDIIDSQNDNTQAIIDSNKVCNYIDKNSVSSVGYDLNSIGDLRTANNNFGVTDYLTISSSSTLTLVNNINQTLRTCFYDVNKSFISCVDVYGLSANSSITIPSNSSYFRSSINLTQNKPTFNLCKNGSQAVSDSINDSDTSGAGSSGSSYFGSFHINDNRGFSNIITAPIRLIQGILNGSSNCSPLSFDVSLKHNSTTQSKEVSLPCGSILWNNVPNTAVLLYHTTIFGLFAWLVLRDMYKFIDSVRDPDNKSEFIMKL